MLQVPLTNIHHITMFTICELRTSHFRFAPSFSISHIQIQFENMFYKYTIVKSQNICKHIIWSEKWKNNWCKISYLYRTWCLSSCHSPSPGKPTYSTSAIWLIQAGPFSRAVCCLIPTMFVNPTLWFFFRTQNWQEMEFNVFCATIVIIQLDFETQRVIFMIFHQIILFKFQAFQYGIYVLQWFANGNNIMTNMPVLWEISWWSMAFRGGRYGMDVVPRDLPFLLLSTFVELPAPLLHVIFGNVYSYKRRKHNCDEAMRIQWSMNTVPGRITKSY